MPEFGTVSLSVAKAKNPIIYLSFFMILLRYGEEEEIASLSTERRAGTGNKQKHHFDEMQEYYEREIRRSCEPLIVLLTPEHTTYLLAMYLIQRRQADLPSLFLIQFYSVGPLFL